MSRKPLLWVIQDILYGILTVVKSLVVWGAMAVLLLLAVTRCRTLPAVRRLDDWNRLG